MTVRTAELVMAIAMALASLGIMWKAAELNIGWLPERGPGSGVWPFWLAVIMLLCCIATIVRWYFRATPESRSNEPFLTRSSLLTALVNVGALVALLLGTHWVGIYISLIVFLAFYFRMVGGHSLLLTAVLSVCTPIGIFILFEYALTIPLPKGISEPLFYPIYDLMY